MGDRQHTGDDPADGTDPLAERVNDLEHEVAYLRDRLRRIDAGLLASGAALLASAPDRPGPDWP